MSLWLVGYYCSYRGGQLKELRRKTKSHGRDSFSRDQTFGNSVWKIPEVFGGEHGDGDEWPDEADDAEAHEEDALEPEASLAQELHAADCFGQRHIKCS